MLKSGPLPDPDLLIVCLFLRLHRLTCPRRKTFEEVPKTVVNFVENGQPNPAFLYDGPPGAWQVTNELGGWGE
jgi:hypothetical protein